MNEASAAVRWLLQQAEPEARRVAVQQIAKVHGGEVADLLLRALADEDWRVRKEAVLVAPALDRREAVVAALVASLGEVDNIGLRNAAVEALVAIGPDAVAATVDALSSLDADGRKLAVEVLGGVPDMRCTTALKGALDDDDANVQTAAAEALGRAALAGEDSREIAAEALVEALSAQGAFVKLAALESLARLGARLPWRVFEPHVRDPMLRRYAIAAACSSHEPQALRALAHAVGDASPTIAREAVAALGELVAANPIDAAVLDVARDALREQGPAARANARRAALSVEDARVRGGALPLLGLLRDPQDVPLLVDALGEEAAERAELALRLFGPEAVDLFLAASAQARPVVRAATFHLAATLEGATPEAADALRRAVRAAAEDASVEVVVAAVETLGRVGEARDLHPLVALFAHEDARVEAATANALWALARRHVDDARALLAACAPGQESLALGCVVLGAVATTQSLRDDEIHLLERALAHDRPRVRRAAVDALAQAGSQTAADAVTFALADEDHDVQLAAVRALGRLGRVEPLLEVVSDAREPVLAAAALRALGDADAARAIAAAAPLVRHADTALACAAVEAIGQLVTSTLTPTATAAREDALYHALEHPDAEVVKLALPLVGAQQGARALTRLGLCLDHASWEVRRVAAELLGQDKGAGAQALLRARYDRERDPIVRSAIAASVSLRPPGRGDGSDRLPGAKEGD